MYQSELHAILVKTLEKTIWMRSTKDEDNFRHVICSSLYTFISPNNVEIPSTRSGNGDIKIFGRKIELKYASNEKFEKLDEILKDFDLLLQDEVQFSIVAIRLDTSDTENFLHQTVRMPMLALSGRQANFGDHGRTPNTYKGISIFLAATYQHEAKAMTLKKGKGKNATAYLSFESAPSITRSSFLQTFKGLVHVDVIGSKEDGLIIFLYKKAHHIVLEKQSGSAFSIDIPYKPAPIKIATAKVVNVQTLHKKFDDQHSLHAKTVEQDVLLFDI